MFLCGQATRELLSLLARENRPILSSLSGRDHFRHFVDIFRPCLFLLDELLECIGICVYTPSLTTIHTMLPFASVCAYIIYHMQMVHFQKRQMITSWSLSLPLMYILQLPHREAKLMVVWKRLPLLKWIQPSGCLWMTFVFQGAAAGRDIHCSRMSDHVLSQLEL